MEPEVDIKVCFYCKKPVLDKVKGGNCPHCDRTLTLVNVKARRQLVSSFLGIFNKKYKYTIENKKYKFIEKYLNK